MKNSKHSLIVPVVFMLAIFLLPSFINLSRPIPLKNNFGNKQSFETGFKSEIRFYSDILIEEELIKDELIKERVLKLDLLDFIILKSRTLALKTLRFNIPHPFSFKHNYPSKFILQKISKWLI